jgi:hypothetical protein
MNLTKFLLFSFNGCLWLLIATTHWLQCFLTRQCQRLCYINGIYSCPNIQNAAPLVPPCMRRPSQPGRNSLKTKTEPYCVSSLPLPQDPFKEWMKDTVKTIVHLPQTGCQLHRMLQEHTYSWNRLHLKPVDCLASQPMSHVLASLTRRGCGVRPFSTPTI